MEHVACEGAGSGDVQAVPRPGTPAHMHSMLERDCLGQVSAQASPCPQSVLPTQGTAGNSERPVNPHVTLWPRHVWERELSVF